MRREDRNKKEGGEGGKGEREKGGEGEGRDIPLRVTLYMRCKAEVTRIVLLAVMTTPTGSSTSHNVDTSPVLFTLA